MKAWLTGLAPALLVAATLGMAVAKLPPAPPMDPATAAAKKEKDAATAAANAAQLAKAEDKAVASYMAHQKAKGTGATPQVAPNVSPVKPMGAEPKK